MIRRQCNSYFREGSRWRHVRMEAFEDVGHVLFLNLGANYRNAFSL